MTEQHTPHTQYAQEIHAYIDGELSAEAREQFEAIMAQDDDLRDMVCELRKIKQQMLSHYQQVEVPPMRNSMPKTNASYWSFAASFLVAIGLGFVLANWTFLQGSSSPSSTSSNLMASQAVSSPNKILLHIDSSQPERTQALLHKANQLLQDAPQKSTVPKMEIEIVANDQGIALFEQDGKSREEIIALLAQYDNLKLVACQRALERRQKAGNPVDLIDKVQADRPAIDVIIDKMQAGWHYYKF